MNLPLKGGLSFEHTIRYSQGLGPISHLFEYLTDDRNIYDNMTSLLTYHCFDDK